MADVVCGSAGHGKMEDVQLKGSACRIKKCAFELLSIGSDLMNDGQSSWELLGRDLRLKSTFLYCDLNQMISCAPRDQKRDLTELANKLFCSIEEVINQPFRSVSLPSGVFFLNLEITNPFCFVAFGSWIMQ